ncbi:hypothetical protein LC605_02460 [Nostoc sp. CHAB 5836]|nr:hypothetical protein [Nostoc sp. CHAB 5836]
MIGNSLQNFVVLESLTFPPLVRSLGSQDPNFFLQHIPTSLVFAYGIDGQDISYPTRKSWGLDAEFAFTK